MTTFASVLAPLTLGSSPESRPAGAVDLGGISGILDNLERSGAALTVLAEQSVGESELLRQTILRCVARGIRVLRADGSRQESTSAPFTALRALLTPVIDENAVLSGRYRATLRMAFDMQTRPSPAQQHAVATAAFELVTAIASRGPLVIVVDRAERLDSASAEVLAFVASRVRCVQVAVIVAIRPACCGPLAGTGVYPWHAPTSDFHRLDWSYVGASVTASGSVGNANEGESNGDH